MTKKPATKKFPKAQSKRRLLLAASFAVGLGLLAVGLKGFCCHGGEPAARTFYFADDNPLTPLGKSLNFFVIDKAEDLAGVFSEDPDQMPEIDYGKNTVVALARPGYSLEIASAGYDGSGNIRIVYAARKVDIDPTVVVSLATVKKRNPTLDLYIYEATPKGEKKRAHVALGRRTLASPQNAGDFVKRYAGTFEGTVPCADCEGIRTKLALNKDGTYSLAETYLGKSKKPLVETGAWRLATDLSAVELTDSEGRSQIYRIVDAKTLAMLDRDGNPIESKHNYTLKKNAKKKGGKKK